KTFSSNLHNQVTPFSYKSLQNKNHLNSSVHYHREIVSAIKEKDRSLACSLMKEHVLNALDVLLDMSAIRSGIHTGPLLQETAFV
ncbi:MAG: FCD domain-containing protein, partial [Deltaproteobacteria bacterium]|nr:FCD domain-containing protein [Deltaproteobacteria bacterium]